MIKAQPFNFPCFGKLEPGKTALLVIDMQVDFLSHEGYFAKKGYDPAALRTILPNVKAVVNAARDAGVRVIWTRQGFRADAADASPYDIWRANRSGIDLTDRKNSVLMRGSEGFDIVPELHVAEQDFIVDKTANGAFYQTDLELVLRAQGISHLMFTGVTTDVCVHTTLREATDRKYQCLTIADACASGDSYAHEAALHMIQVEDGIFGAVATSEGVINGLNTLSD